MTDALDVPLRDGELLAEIHMTSDLMIVAAQYDGPVGQEIIDGVLHVEAAVDQAC